MIDELYQDIILQHSKHPSNFGEIQGPCSVTHLHNPLCGDDIVLSLRVVGDIVEDCKFAGTGCALSKAVSSIFSEKIIGKNLAEVREILELYKQMLDLNRDEAEVDDNLLGDLVVFENVRKYPTRIKCVTLFVEALNEALKR